MILLLMIMLAVLIWTIQGEIDRSTREPVQAVGDCSGCHAPVEPEWLVCPHCRKRLSASCVHCHRGKLLSQRHCPYCGERSQGGAG